MTFFVTLTLLPPSHKDPCDYIELTRLIQDPTPTHAHLKGLNLIVPAKSLPSHNMWSQVLGIKMWASLGGYYSTCHIPQNVKKRALVTHPSGAVFGLRECEFCPWFEEVAWDLLCA